MKLVSTLAIERYIHWHVRIVKDTLNKHVFLVMVSETCEVPC